MQSILHFFLYSLVKEMTDKPANGTAVANLFFSVYIIGMTCFDECFLFYVITERHNNPNTKLCKLLYCVTVPHSFFINDFLYYQNLSGSMFLLTCVKTEFS